MQMISKAAKQTPYLWLGAFATTAVLLLLLGGLVILPPATLSMFAIATTIGLIILLSPHVGFLLMIASLGFEAITIGVPVTIFRILAIWTFCSWILKQLLAGRVPVVRASQNACIAAFMLTALVSAFFALQPGASTMQIATLIQLGVLYFFVTGIVNSEQRLTHVAWAWIIGGTAASLYAIATFASQGLARAVGGVSDPNYLVLYLTIPLALSLELFQVERSFLLKIFLIFSLLAFLAVTILSFSRGGLISVMVILVLWFFKSQNKSRITAFLLTIAIAILIVFSFLPAIPLQSWLQRISPQLALQDAGAGRFYIWRGGLDMFLDHPLVGVGIGNFLYRYPEYSYYDPRGAQQRVAHNTFLEVAAEQGIFGLLAFLSLLWVTYRYLRIAATVAQERKLYFTAQLAQAFHFGFLGFLAGSFFLTAHLSKSLWLLFGLTVAVYNIINRR